MAYRSMTVETISISGNKGEQISAYVARPMGAGPFPGVVLIHHAPGWDEWYSSVRGNPYSQYNYTLNENEVAILGLRTSEWFDGACDTFMYGDDLVSNFTIPRKLRRHLEKIGIVA